MVALSAVRSAPHRNITIQPLADGHLTLPASHTIAGDTKQTLVIDGRGFGSLIKATNNGTFIIDGFGTVRIHNMWFAPDWTNPTVNQASALRLNNCSNVEIYNCTFYKTNDSALNMDCDSVLVKDCFFAPSGGLAYGHEGSGLVCFVDCVFAGTSGRAPKFKTQGSYMKNCILADTGSYSWSSTSEGVGVAVLGCYYQHGPSYTNTYAIQHTKVAGEGKTNLYWQDNYIKTSTGSEHTGNPYAPADNDWFQLVSVNPTTETTWEDAESAYTRIIGGKTAGAKQADGSNHPLLEEWYRRIVAGDEILSINITAGNPDAPGDDYFGTLGLSDVDMAGFPTW